MAATYQGKPCRYGHGTLRYASNRRCVVCDRMDDAQARERMAGALAARDAREAAIADGRRTYHGQPCGCCGGTLRYTHPPRRNCVECRALRRRGRVVGGIIGARLPVSTVGASLQPRLETYCRAMANLCRR